jgi:hypothetical protein
VLKTVRLDHKRQVTVNQHDQHLQKSKTETALESTNLYATNFELGAIPQLLSINSAAADGASMSKCFKRSPPTATLNVPLSTKARLWWC